MRRYIPNAYQGELKRPTNKMNTGYHVYFLCCSCCICLLSIGTFIINKGYNFAPQFKVSYSIKVSIENQITITQYNWMRGFLFSIICNRKKCRLFFLFGRFIQVVKTYVVFKNIHCFHNDLAWPRCFIISQLLIKQLNSTLLLLCVNSLIVRISDIFFIWRFTNL